MPAVLSRAREAATLAARRAARRAAIAASDAASGAGLHVGSRGALLAAAAAAAATAAALAGALALRRRRAAPSPHTALPPSAAAAAAATAAAPHNNNYQTCKSAEQPGARGCGGCGGAEGEQEGGGGGGGGGGAPCALCQGTADTDNKQHIGGEEGADGVLGGVLGGVGGALGSAVGVNVQFVREVWALWRIMVPGVRTREAALLLAHTACLFARTLLSIYVATLEGSIVREIVEKRVGRFLWRLVAWFGIALPATFTNSMIRYLESQLALAFRTRLVRRALALYFARDTYYRVGVLDSRIENADHRIVEDVAQFATSVAHLYGSLTKPCFDLLLIVLSLGQRARRMRGNVLAGPALAALVVAATAQLLRALSPQFGALAAEEARRHAHLRHVHARLIAHAEEIAFYGGHRLELATVLRAYGRVVAQASRLLRVKLWYVMLEQLCMKYVWSGTGMVVLALPILTAGADPDPGPGSDPDPEAGISARTEFMTTSRHLLNSAADAIERLLSSYKEIVTLAGYSERVAEMLEVFEQVGAGECVRAHLPPAPSPLLARPLHYRAGQPQPLGVVEYVEGGAGEEEGAYEVVVEGVPVVAPGGEVVCGEVWLRLRAGRHTLVLGPNGCGKSSLFRILRGLWPVYAGRLTLPAPCACAACAAPLRLDTAAPPPCKRRPIMFYIPQRPYLCEGSLLDQVTYPARVQAPPAGPPGSEHAQEAQEAQEAERRALAAMGVARLEGVVARLGAEGVHAVRDWHATLSGGEKQRVGMARLLYHRPVYALLDECTAAVSADTECALYEEAVRQGITLLSITHRPATHRFHTHELVFDGHGHALFRPRPAPQPASQPAPLPAPEPAPQPAPQQLGDDTAL